MSVTKAENLHKPVLLDEVLELFRTEDKEVVVDATLGLGGHTEAILRSSPLAEAIGIDQDAAAIAFAAERLEKFGERIRIFKSNFSGIKEVLNEAAVSQVDGILADLGVSSLQFDTGERGFSFRFDAPLDMRMDADSDEPTAAELLATLSEEEIADIIYKFGEERNSRRIARRIVWKRDLGEAITTTKELAETVEKAVKQGSKDKIHPATKTFQALRIAVNGEIEILEEFLNDAVDLLKPDGKLAVITFHSLEDRIVKQTFLKLSGRCSCPPRMPQCMCGAVKKVEVITRKPIIPGDEETQENPRARSAKLRVVRKLS